MSALDWFPSNKHHSESNVQSALVEYENAYGTLAKGGDLFVDKTNEFKIKCSQALHFVKIRIHVPIVILVSKIQR